MLGDGSRSGRQRRHVAALAVKTAPVDRGRHLYRRIEIVAKRSAERRFIASCNADLLDDGGPEIGCFAGNKLGDGPRLGFQPLCNAFCLGKSRPQRELLVPHLGMGTFALLKGGLRTGQSVDTIGDARRQSLLLRGGRSCTPAKLFLLGERSFCLPPGAGQPLTGVPRAALCRGKARLPVCNSRLNLVEFGLEPS